MQGAEIFCSMTKFNEKMICRKVVRIVRALVSGGSERSLRLCCSPKISEEQALNRVLPFLKLP